MKKRELPIAAAMRRMNQNKKLKLEDNITPSSITDSIPATTTTTTSVSELEEKIAQLERKLTTISSSSEDDDDDDDDGEEENDDEEEEKVSKPEIEEEKEKVENNGAKKKKSRELIEVLDQNGNVVAIQSRLIEEKIIPLPRNLLPDPNCGATRSKQHRHKKTPPTSPSQQISPGLEKSIREMLKNYQPTSSEKRPFWCRICLFQGHNENEFIQHRHSQLHQLAVKYERKLSLCKLCHKEFTSPEQLKEHLKGKLHQERFKFLKLKQQGKKFLR